MVRIVKTEFYKLKRYHIPVSYTHLDVYKRQGLPSYFVTSSTSGHVGPRHRKEGSLGGSTRTVSYTHLFVDRFPQNTELYAIMTTRPEDKKQEMNRA